MMIVKISFLFLSIFLCGCSQNIKKADDSLSLSKLQHGMLRLMALTDKNLNLEKIKDIYKDDFSESSKKYNNKTKS